MPKYELVITNDTLKSTPLTLSVLELIGPQGIQGPRGVIGVDDNGGDGSLEYDSTTGTLTYTGPSAAEVRAHLSAGGDLSYNSTTGVISFTERTDAEVRQLFSVSGDLSYNNTTGIFSFTERTDAEVRGLFSVAGDLSYNSTTGIFSFTERTDAEVRGLVSASGDLSYNNTTGVFSFTERTDAEVRGLVSATDAGGDGSFSYDSATGVFTYTGPSASEVRDHFSGGTGVTITDGEIAIGQAVGTTANVNFGNATLSGYLAGPATFTIDPAAVGNNTGKVVIAGDLQVDGTTTTVNSTTVEVADKNVVLGANATAGTENDGAGITVSRPDSTDATISWDETNDEWDVTNGLSVAGDIAVSGTVDGRNVAADGDKLDLIEDNADVTDTANVTAAGALMDSEVTNLAQVKAFDSADYATAAQGALADTAVQPNDSPTFGTLNATTVDLGDWTITESGGFLYFATGGNNKMKLDASGNLDVVGSVNANATIS